MFQYLSTFSAAGQVMLLLIMSQFCCNYGYWKTLLAGQDRIGLKWNTSTPLHSSSAKTQPARMFYQNKRAASVFQYDYLTVWNLLKTQMKDRKEWSGEIGHGWRLTNKYTALNFNHHRYAERCSATVTAAAQVSCMHVTPLWSNMHRAAINMVLFSVNLSFIFVCQSFIKSNVIVIEYCWLQVVQGKKKKSQDILLTFLNPKVFN